MISKLSSFLTLTLALSLLGAVTAQTLTGPPGEVSLIYYPPGTNFAGICGIEVDDNTAVATLDGSYFADGTPACNYGIMISGGWDNVSTTAAVGGICQQCPYGSGEIQVTRAVFGNLPQKPTLVKWFFIRAGSDE